MSFFFRWPSIHSGEELFLSVVLLSWLGFFSGEKIHFVFFLWKNLVKCAASNLSSMCVLILHVCIYDFYGFFCSVLFFVCFFFSFIVTYSDYSGAGWCFGWCLVFVVRAKHMKMTYVLKRRKLLT